MKVVYVIFGLVIANFGYQIFTKQNWGVATERSFFQVLAVLTYVLV